MESFENSFILNERKQRIEHNLNLVVISFLKNIIDSYNGGPQQGYPPKMHHELKKHLKNKVIYVCKEIQSIDLQNNIFVKFVHHAHKYLTSF